MKNAIDLMRIEIQDMNTNEQALVGKVKDIDSQNKKLLNESSTLSEELRIYKDKARQLLEIQLSQATANERILNESLQNCRRSISSNES